jgi:hypothetical protein
VFLQQDSKRADAQLIAERKHRQMLQAELEALRRQAESIQASGSQPSAVLNVALIDLTEDLSKEAALNDKLMQKAEALLETRAKQEAAQGVGSREGSLRVPDGASALDDAGLQREMRSIAKDVLRRELANERLLLRVKEVQKQIRCAASCCAGPPYGPSDMGMGDVDLRPTLTVHVAVSAAGCIKAVTWSTCLV